MPDFLHPHLLESLKAAIVSRLGLKDLGRDDVRLADVVRARVRALGIGSLEGYLAMLEHEGKAGVDEWTTLADTLVNGETYFFRDHGQMAALRSTVLPGLIRNNRDTRTLRIWSAGCSTGEEPYSLAILVNELLPEHRDWTIRILATDVSTAALAKAREAVYPQWSFRMVDPAFRSMYFSPKGGGQALRDTIRSMVEFRHLNLLDIHRAGKSLDLSGMDLIVCRNVFIYFSTEAIQHVVSGIRHALKDGGYALFGHAEIVHSIEHDFRSILLENAIVYQKAVHRAHVPLHGFPAVPTRDPQTVAGQVALRDPIQALAAGPWSAPNEFDTMPHRRPAPPRNDGPMPPVDAAHTDAEPADAPLESLPLNALEARADREPPDYDALILCARRLADLGHRERAEERCHRAATLKPFDPYPHYLLAQLANDHGQIDEAMLAYRRALYIRPDFFAASLELAALHLHQNNHARASSLWKNALHDLQQLPPDSPASPYDGITVCELIDDVRRAMAELAAPATTGGG